MTGSGPRTAFLLHPDSSLHDTGWGHPEHQGRLRALSQTVGRDMMALHGRAEQLPAETASVDDVLRVHTGAHVERIREAVARAGREEAVVSLNADTRVSGSSWDAALGALGAALTAAEAVANGDVANAFVATRPPGHHATPDTAMGFCLVNHVACTARWLQETDRAERVLIVDWDVHHGNGTQDVFFQDPTVFYLSLHQSPHYPGTGMEHEVGVGAGEGFTKNVTLRAGTSREAYLTRFVEALDDVFGRFDPDVVLVSAGFDCLAGDPLGGQSLEPEDTHRMTRDIMERSQGPAGGRIVTLLEGGYDPKRTGLGAVAVIRALAGVDEADPASPVSPA